MTKGPTPEIAAAEVACVRREIALAAFEDGGLLLDLRSGNLFRLDPRAVAVWQSLVAANDPDEASEKLRGSLAVSLDVARAFVASALEQRRISYERFPPTPFRIAEDERALSLYRDGRPLIELDRRSMSLVLLHRRSKDQPQPEDDFGALIRMFLPRLLSTWFPLALHASAVDLSGRVVLFAGASGAGKTTTARTLAAEVAGARVVSEDIVVFSRVSVDDRATVLLEAEPIVRRWIDAAVASFSDTPDAPVGLRALGDELSAASEEKVAGKIIFIDSSQRSGRRWSMRALNRADALAALFLNSFLPSAAPDLLARHLESCRAVATSVSAHQATVIPSGLPDLRASARDQSAMIAS